MREVRFRDQRKSATLLSSNFMRHDTQCTYKRKLEGRSHNHCCSGKTITIAYSECVFVALVTQHAKRMGPNILSPIFLRCVIPVVLVQLQRILCITRTVEHNYIYRECYSWYRSSKIYFKIYLKTSVL